MSWHCSRALVADFLGAGCSDGEPSAPSRSIPTAAPSSCKGRTRDTLSPSRFGTTCERLTEFPGGARWMSSLRASPASRSVSQASDSALMTTATYGQTPSESFAKWDPRTSSWKTSRLFAAPNRKAAKRQGRGFLTHPTSGEFLATWPRAGFMLSGIVFQRRPLVPISLAIACGSRPRVPRPVACDGKGSGRVRHERSQGMNLRDWWNANYRFVYPPARVTEYLMGFPIAWTDLEPLETRRFQQWLERHGNY